MLATLLKTLGSWLFSRLFGGDKTAELAEKTGALETENAGLKKEIANAEVKQAENTRVDRLSDTAVDAELRARYQRDRD